MKWTFDDQARVLEIETYDQDSKEFKLVKIGYDLISFYGCGKPGQAILITDRPYPHTPTICLLDRIDDRLWKAPDHVDVPPFQKGTDNATE